MSIPLSFDFGSEAIRPDYVIKCSYGNDSIALIQWIHEWDTKYKLGKVVVLYNNTGWATNWWPERVKKGEELSVRYGFIPCTTTAIPWLRLILEHNTWPDRLRRFCTEDLKIVPTMNWLSKHDPGGKATMVCGVRREESFARRSWPEYVEASERNEGRPEWSPLVLHNEDDRNKLILRAGWRPLPHRSRECRCVLANSYDISTWSEEDTAEIEAMERALSNQNQGSNKFMFHPLHKKGNPEGIRKVVEWAKQVQSDKNDKSDTTDIEPTGCDSGYCSG